MGDRWADLSYALGGWSGRQDPNTRKPIDGRKSRWKPNIGVLKAVVQFVKATGRLQPGEKGREVEAGVEAGVRAGVEREVEEV